MRKRMEQRLLCGQSGGRKKLKGRMGMLLYRLQNWCGIAKERVSVIETYRNRQRAGMTGPGQQKTVYKEPFLKSI